MLNWLLYTMLVGGLLTLAAHCVERVCQLLTLPTRWVWVSALTLTVVLAGAAPYRAAMRSRAQLTQRVAPLTGSEVRQQTPPSTGRLPESVQFVRREMTTPTITIPAQRVPVSLDAYLAVTWGMFSAVVLLFFSTVYLRFYRARRGWPISDLHGVRVRIAPDGGPVVLGLRNPEIVIPQWLLGRSAEEQRMVLTHEQEHIRAGDPWVLAIACGIAALLPWHPLVWWMISRLRLAIELDCDTRVLSRGIAPQTYGSLLIDLAARCSGLPVRALALADNRSHLKQRLLAMKSFRPRFAAMQRFFWGSSAVLLFVTACIAQVPAPADRRMAPEEWNRRYVEMARMYPNDMDNLFSGAKTPKDSAKIFFGFEGLSSFGCGVGGGRLPSSTKWSQFFINDSVADSVYAHLFAREAALNAAEPNALRDSVLVLVDGVRRGVFPIDEPIPFSQLNLSRDGIQQFDRHRGGHWAVVLYGPQAANGVIDVITKEGAARRRVAMFIRADSLGEWGRDASYSKELTSSQQLIQFFDSVEYKNLGDSVLVLVDSTRRGMFPIHERIPFSRLNLRPIDIDKFITTSGRSATIKNGADATHGVINIITIKKAKS